MALRLQTTQTAAEGGSFVPSGEVLLQAQVLGLGRPVIDVLVKVHNDAPWQAAVSFLPHMEPFKRLASFPQMKIAVRENAEGATVSVWDQA